MEDRVIHHSVHPVKSRIVWSRMFGAHGVDLTLFSLNRNVYNVTHHTFNPVSPSESDLIRDF